MKLATTIEVFGEPFIADYVSDDRRIYASREKCLELHSFPHRRDMDSEALRLSLPVKLEWQSVPDPALEPLRESIREKSVDRWMAKPAPPALCTVSFANMFKPSTPVRVVRAVLGNGMEVILRNESGQFRQLPSGAHQHFKTDAAIAKLEAATVALAMKAQPITPEVESMATKLMELAALDKDGRTTLAQTIEYLGYKKPVFYALTEYAQGATEDEAAAIMQRHVRTFRRKLAGIPEYHRKYFDGSLEERLTRKRMNVRDFVNQVQILRDGVTPLPVTLPDVADEDDDKACIEEQFTDLRADCDRESA